MIVGSAGFYRSESTPSRVKRVISKSGMERALTGGCSQETYQPEEKGRSSARGSLSWNLPVWLPGEL